MAIKRYKLLQFLGFLTVAVCDSYSQKLSSNNVMYFESSRISARNPSAITDQVESKDADKSLRNNPNLLSVPTQDYTTNNYQNIVPIQSTKDSSHLTSLHSSTFQKRLGTDTSNLHKDSLSDSLDLEDTNESYDSDTEFNISQYESFRIREIPHSRVNKKKFRNDNGLKSKARNSQFLKKTGTIKPSLTKSEAKKEVDFPGNVKNDSEENAKTKEVKPENDSGKTPNKRLKRKKVVRVRQQFAKNNTNKDEANEKFSEQKANSNFNVKAKAFSGGANKEKLLKSHTEKIQQDHLHKKENTQNANQEMDKDIQKMERAKNANSMKNENYLLTFLRNIGEKLMKDHEQPQEENETPEWVSKYGSGEKSSGSDPQLVSFNYMGKNSVSRKDLPKVIHHAKVRKPVNKNNLPSQTEKEAFKKASYAKDAFYAKKESTYFNREHKKQQQESDFHDENAEHWEDSEKKKNEDLNDHLEFLNPMTSLFNEEKSGQEPVKNQPSTTLVKRKQLRKHKKPVWHPTVSKKNTRNNKLNHAKEEFHSYRPQTKQHQAEYDYTEGHKQPEITSNNNKKFVVSKSFSNSEDANEPFFFAPAVPKRNTVPKRKNAHNKLNHVKEEFHNYRPETNRHQAEYDYTEGHKQPEITSNNNKKFVVSKSFSNSEDGSEPFFFAPDVPKRNAVPKQKNVESHDFEEIVTAPHKLDSGGYFMHMYNRMGNLGLSNFDLNGGEVPPVDGHVSEMTLRWTDDDTKAVVEAFLDITKNSGTNDEGLFGEDFEELNYRDFDNGRGNFGAVESENDDQYSKYEPHEDSNSFSADDDFENESPPRNSRKKRSAINNTESYVKSHFKMDKVEVQTNYTPKDDTTKADFLKRIGHPVNINQTKVVVYVSPTPVQARNKFDKKDQEFDVKQNEKKKFSNSDGTLTSQNIKTNVKSDAVIRKDYFLRPSEAQEKQKLEHEFQARNSYFLFDKYKEPQRGSFRSFQTYQTPKTSIKNKSEAQHQFKPQMRTNGNMHKSYTLEKPKQIGIDKTNFSTNLKSNSSSESAVTQPFSDFGVPKQSNKELIKTDKDVLETRNSGEQLNSSTRNPQTDIKNTKDKTSMNADHFLSSENPATADVKMFFHKNNFFGERQNETNAKLGIERKDNEWIYTEDANDNLDNSHHSNDHFDDERQAEFIPSYTSDENRIQNEDIEENRGVQNGYSFDFGRNEWINEFHEEEDNYPTYSSIPKTDFTCKGKKRPGYYADTEAGCQVFHMCQQTGEKHSFLCPNTTVFNQQLLVCDWHSNVKCEKSESFYDINEHIYQPAVQLSEYDYQSRQNSKRTDGRSEVVDEFPKPDHEEEIEEKRPRKVSWLPKFPAFNYDNFRYHKPTAKNTNQEDDLIVKKEVEERKNPKLYKFDEIKDHVHSRTGSKEPQFLHLYNTRESPQQEKRSKNNPEYLEVKSSWDPKVLKKILEDELRTTPEDVRSFAESDDDKESHASYLEEENSSAPTDAFDYFVNANSGKQKVTESDANYTEKNSRKRPGKNSNSSKNFYNKKHKSSQKVYVEDDQDTSESTESVSKTIPTRKNEKMNGRSNYHSENQKVNIFNTTSGKLELLPYGSNHRSSKYKQHYDVTEIRKPINISIPYHSKEYKTIPNGVTYQTEGQTQRDVPETATNPVNPRYTYPPKELTQIDAAEKEFNYGYRTENPVTIRSPPEKNKDYVLNDKFPVQKINLRIANIKTGIENIGKNVEEILQNNDKNFKNIRVYKLKPKILPNKKDDQNLDRSKEHQVLQYKGNELVLETPQHMTKTEPNYITENPATYEFSNKPAEKHTLENAPHQSWLTKVLSQNNHETLVMKPNSDDGNVDITTIDNEHLQGKQKLIVKPLAKPHYIAKNKEHVKRYPVITREKDHQEHKNYQNEDQINKNPKQFTIKMVPISKGRVNPVVIDKQFTSQKLAENINHEDVNYKPASSLHSINEQNDFIPTVPMKYFSRDKIPKNTYANEYSTRLQESDGRNTNKVIIIPLLPKTNVVHLQNSGRYLPNKAFDNFNEQMDHGNNEYQPHQEEIYVPQRYPIQKIVNKENIHLRQKEQSSSSRKAKPYYIIPVKSLPKYENSGQRLIVEITKRPAVLHGKIEDTFNHPRKHSNDKYKTIKIETDLSADCEESLEHNRNNLPPEIQLGKNGPMKIIPDLYRNLYPQFPKSTAQDLSDGSQSRCNDRSTAQEDTGKNTFELKNHQPTKHKIEKIIYPSSLFIKQIQDFKKSTGFLKNKDRLSHGTNTESLSGYRKPLQDTSHREYEQQIHIRPTLVKPIVRQKLVLEDNLEHKHYPLRQQALKQDHRSSIESKELQSNEGSKPIDHDSKSYYKALEKAAEFRTQKRHPVVTSTNGKRKPTQAAVIRKGSDEEVSHTSEESRDVEERIPSNEATRYAALEKEAELKAERMIRKKGSHTTNQT